MPVEIERVDHRIVKADLRMPFHFGSVEIVSIPQLFTVVDAAVDGTRSRGVAQEGLSPLWFLKDVPFGTGLDRLVTSVRTAGDHATAVGRVESAFDLWMAVHDRPRAWGDGTHPPLLWAFGPTMVERATIDAVCRATDTTFSTAIRDGTLGFDPGRVHDELDGADPADLLPERPRRSAALRHTVGLGDPLTDDAIESPVGDGLPQSLAAYVREHGVAHFKIKIRGDPDADGERLGAIAGVLDDCGVDEYAVTLDANESYATAAAFVDGWADLRATDGYRAVADHLLYVEQPVARGRALDASAADALNGWDGPPLVVDESDGTLDGLPRALDIGYAGTTHKNCKGVFKGVANACLVERRERETGDPHHLSGEDLSVIGPVGLTQDLAVQGTIGVAHVERNGHHYFDGLSAFPDDLQRRTLEAHNDLYEPRDGGVTVRIDGGRVAFGSAVASPFGYGCDVDPERFEPLDDWTFSPA
jgi:hypothetical protein